MNTLRLGEPISCQEVRSLLPHLKTLDAERRGRVRGHLDRCKDCFPVRKEQVTPEERQEKEAIPASLLKSARGVISAYLIARQGVLGLVWEKVREVASQGEAWAKEKLTEGQSWIKGTMVLWQMTPALDGAWGLGAARVPPLGAKGIAAEVVDDTWQPQGKVVPFEVREDEGPVVTADGRFTFTLHTPEAQWQGAQAVCTVLLVQGQRVSFESVVQLDLLGKRGQVSFTAEGLPQGAKVPVPLELVRLYLIAPNKEVL
jgi:hypothetical protein